MLIKEDYLRYPGSKVYFTEADLSSQILYSIKPDELSVKLKLWLLLADHVILSTGHMIRSDMTYKWLYEHSDIVAELSSEKAILPSLSDKYENYTHFALDQVVDAKHKLKNKDRNEVKNRSGFLDDIFQAAITWSSESESNLFRDMIAKNINYRTSPLGRRMVGVSNKSLDYLSNLIMDTEEFDRGRLYELANKYCPKRAKTILRYGDCYYYLSGSLFKDAIPIMHSNAVGLCREQIAKNTEKTYDNPDVWGQIMDYWGLTACTLYHLPLKEVLEIRKDPLGKRVRKTWHKLMKAAKSAKNTDNQLEQFIHVRNELLDMFKREVDVQRKRKERMYAGRFWLEIGSWATSGVGTFFLTGEPISSFAVGILGMLAGRPILDSIEKKLPRIELILLADSIRSRVKQQT